MYILSLYNRFLLSTYIKRMESMYSFVNLNCETVPWSSIYLKLRCVKSSAQVKLLQIMNEPFFIEQILKFNWNKSGKVRFPVSFLFTYIKPNVIKATLPHNFSPSQHICYTHLSIDYLIKHSCFATLIFLNFFFFFISNSIKHPMFKGIPITEKLGSLFNLELMEDQSIKVLPVFGGGGVA